MTATGYSLPHPASDSGWPARPATGPVQATVSVPGSKSLTNRKLVLAALAAGQLGVLPERIALPFASSDPAVTTDVALCIP